MMTHPQDRRQRLILKKQQDEKKRQAKEGAYKSRLNLLKERDTDEELKDWTTRSQG